MYLSKKGSRARNRGFLGAIEGLERRQVFSGVNWDVNMDGESAPQMQASAMSTATLNAGDDFGNDFSTATSVGLNANGGRSLTGNIEQSGDQDMIHFVAPVSGRMTITQNATRGSQLDTYVYAYDSNRNLIGQDDDSGPELNSRLQINVIAGRSYYVRADAYLTSTGGYRLGMTTEATDDHGNTFSSATGVSLDSAGTGGLAGIIDQTGDQDMFRFVATTSGRMTVTQNAGSDSPLDTYVYVYDANRNLTGQDDDSGPGLNSRLRFNVIAGSTYYIQADAFGTTFGAYRVGMATEIVDDHGNDFANATTLNLDSSGSRSLNGVIERSGDQDMLRFVATTSGRMTLVQDAASGSSLDTYVYAYDANRNLIGQDDDSGPGLNSRLQFNVIAGQTYYVQADAYSTSIGGYQVRLATETVGGTSDRFTLFLNFDGVALTAAEMDRYANSLDPENDGVRVTAAYAGRGDRETIIHGIMGRVQADLSPFGIAVVRHFGTTVENVGATTIYIGPSTMFHPHIASSIDFGNNNATDIAFVGEEYWGGVTSNIITALSDVVLHEAGHTYGLYHVNSVQGGVIYNESMGLRYSTSQSEWLRDTSFLDRAFAEYEGHGGGRGTQNTYRVMAANFARSNVVVDLETAEEPDVFDHLLPVYRDPGTDGHDWRSVAQGRYDAVTASLADAVFANRRRGLFS